MRYLISFAMKKMALFNLWSYECHATLNEEGALALISIYIDTRDEDEATDEVGYIEEELTKTTTTEEDLF